MVHDQDDGRFGIDPADRRLVGAPQPDPVERARRGARNAVAPAEVDVGVERRDDLLGVAPDALEDDFGAHTLFSGVALRRLEDPGVEEQPVDQRLMAGELERLDLDPEAAVELLHHALAAPAQHPARRPHDERDDREQGEPGEEHDQPERQNDSLRHGAGAGYRCRWPGGGLTSGSRSNNLLVMQPEGYSNTTTDSLNATFAALADPTRRAILARLADGEASVAELAAPFAMSQPAISKHLKVLERAGLVSRGIDAQRRPSRLEAQPLAEANAWLESYREYWEASFQQLDSLLDELKVRDRKRQRTKVTGEKP